MIKTGSGTFDDKERTLPTKEIEKIAKVNIKKAALEEKKKDAHKK